MNDALVVRRAWANDLPAVLELTRRALGWTDDDVRFLRWKHLENPFGVSPMWIALSGERLVGFRAFLRWEFRDPLGRTVIAGRAVDTATDPDFQGRGIFTRLTLEAVDALPAEGIELIFNTPNNKSRPGYLKMGWREVGRLPLVVRPTSARFPAVVATARRAAGRQAVPSMVGEDPAVLFTGPTAPDVDRLIESLAGSAGLTTRRSSPFLAWRYGHEDLGYRVVLAGANASEGLAVFRSRRRGRAVEVVLCELLVPEGNRRVERRLLRQVAALPGADYVIRLDRRPVTRGGFVRLPGVGPVLACRSLRVSPTGESSVPPAAAWALTMGDVELF